MLKDSMLMIKEHVWSLCLHSVSPMQWHYARLLTSFHHPHINRLQNSQHRKDWTSFQCCVHSVQSIAGGNFSSQNLKGIGNQILTDPYSNMESCKMEEEKSTIYIVHVLFSLCRFLHFVEKCSFIPLNRLLFNHNT